MNKSMRKDLFRSIRKSLTRFLCIVAIIALGISFFVGMKSASPDMSRTANEYYLESNLMDIQVTSSIGFTSEEVKKISELEGVDAADAVKAVDALVFSGKYGVANAANGSIMACKVMSMDFNRADSYLSDGQAENSYINRVKLIDGRFPENKNECVIDSAAEKNYGELAIDSVITLEGDNETIDGKLNTFEYRIVGTVESPMYCSYDRGETKISSGALGMFMYVSEDCFVSKNYDLVFATVDNKGSYDVYSDEYEEYTKEIGEKIEVVSQNCISSRLSQVKKEYTADLERFKADYKKTEEQAKVVLNEALDNINDVQNYIDNGNSQISGDKTSLSARVESAEKRLDSSKEKYDQSKKDYEKDKSEANDKGNQINGYKQGKKIYDDFLKKHQADRKEIDSMRSELAKLDKEIKSKADISSKAKENYDSAVKSVENKEEKLKEIQKNLQDCQKKASEWTEDPEWTEEEKASQQKEYEKLQNQISKYSESYKHSEEELNKAKAQLAEAEKAKSSAASEYENVKSKYLELQSQIEQREITYEKNLEILSGYAEDVKRLQEGEEALTIFKHSLTESEQKLLEAKISITESQLRLYYEESTGNQKITAEEASLKAAKTRLENAEKKYSEEEHNVKSELRKIQGNIDKTQLALDELNSSVWNVSYQNDLPGFESYRESIENVKEISTVFPIFFFMIAAFIFLATMTRMVQEERMQLGTLKALGFVNGKILSKYYVYALIAGISGSVLGSLIGTYTFPAAIDRAYGMMFTMPSAKLSFNWSYIIGGTAVSIVLSLAVTSIACRRELKTQAAHLMRPKAPEAGKRLFIERFTSIWSNVSFGSIVTLRNMFRSKRRMFVTIFGVAGCTALILTAIGLNNSVDRIIERQFGNGSIIHYDINLSFDEGQEPNKSDLVNNVNRDVRVDGSMLVHLENVSATSVDETGKTVKSVNVIVPSEASKFHNYITIRQRKTGRGMIPGEAGAIISEKLAKDTGVSPGGTLKVKTVSGKKYDIPVRDVCENYLDHYIYISPEKYQEVFSEAPVYKNLLVNLAGYAIDSDRQTLADDLMSMTGVVGISSCDVRIQSYNSVVDRLDAITMIFITAAGLLALIVLYNLTNISVQERLREIATVRVLGFTDSELAVYVYRENIINTVAGIVFGTGLGMLLHKYIINKTEVSIAMFGRNIYWWSYILAAFLTAVFAAAVFVMIYRKMQKFDTVAALKSVE